MIIKVSEALTMATGFAKTGMALRIDKVIGKKGERIDITVISSARTWTMDQETVAREDIADILSAYSEKEIFVALPDGICGADEILLAFADKKKASQPAPQPTPNTAPANPNNNTNNTNSNPAPQNNGGQNNQGSQRHGQRNQNPQTNPAPATPTPATPAPAAPPVPTPATPIAPQKSQGWLAGAWNLFDKK